MEKKDLIEYERKINNLSADEQKLREIYLKQMADGTLQGPSLKEESITHTKNRYYSDEQLSENIPNLSIYEYLKERNKDNLDSIALDYFDKKITYRELFENIDKAAKVFINNGVKQGDIVSMSFPTIPESVYMFYALNKIGAISNMVDPRVSAEQLRDYINEVNSKLFVGIDLYDSKFKKALKGTGVKKSILISAGQSMPDGKIKFGSNLLSKLKTFRIHRIPTKNYATEVKKASNVVLPENIDVKADDVVAIVHTGGTTGKSKGVMLTSTNLNASAQQAEHTGYDLNPTDTWLNIMPPFIAYGVGNGLHLPLTVGMKVVLIPQFNPDKFPDYIIKYKPNEIAGVPSHYENLIQSEKLKNFDLSFLKAPIVGGDSMDPSLERETTAFLKSHGCKSGVLKGYGLSEESAAVSLPTTTGENKLKSVGVPFSKTTISIFEKKENGERPADNYYEELGHNEVGEVCITGPNTMAGYYNNEAETENVLREHADGKTWAHTGDLGYMDDDGNLFIVDREKRIIIRHDGFKIFPSIIKDVVSANPAVKLCEVVGVRDESHVQGKLPKVFIVLNDEYLDKEEAVIRQLEKECSEKLSEYYLPITFEAKESLPLTLIGKVDYKELENEEEAKRQKAR